MFSTPCADDLIAEVRSAGGSIRRDGEMIELKAPKPLPRQLVERIRAAKPFVLQALAEDEEPMPRPLPLRDDRRLYRFSAQGIPQSAPDEVSDLVRLAFRHRAGLVADGMELIVIEPRTGSPPAILSRLRGEAGAVIAALRGQHRARTGEAVP